MLIIVPDIAAKLLSRIQGTSKQIYVSDAGASSACQMCGSYLICVLFDLLFPNNMIDCSPGHS